MQADCNPCRSILVFAVFCAVFGGFHLRADTLIVTKERAWHPATRIWQAAVVKDVQDRIGYIDAKDATGKEIQFNKFLVIVAYEIPELIPPKTFDKGEYARLQEIGKRLNALSESNPKIKNVLMPYVSEFAAKIQPELQRFERGDIKKDGIWYSKAEYAKKLSDDKVKSDQEQKVAEQEKAKQFEYAEQQKAKAFEARKRKAVQAEIERQKRKQKYDVLANALKNGRMLSPDFWRAYLLFNPNYDDLVANIGKPDYAIQIPDVNAQIYKWYFKVDNNTKSGGELLLVRSLRENPPYGWQETNIIGKYNIDGFGWETLPTTYTAVPLRW